MVLFFFFALNTVHNIYNYSVIINKALYHKQFTVQMNIVCHFSTETIYRMQTPQCWQHTVTKTWQIKKNQAGTAYGSLEPSRTAKIQKPRASGLAIILKKCHKVNYFVIS